MIFYQLIQWCPLASNWFIIITNQSPKWFLLSFLWYVPPQSFARLFLRTYPSQTSLCCLNVVGWFRSTSSDFLLVGTHPLRFNDFYIIVWFRPTSSNRCRHAAITLQRLVWYVPPFIFCKTFPSHISVTAFTVSHIIGLFRSTVLRVMSPTRFLCATMILYAPPIAYRLVANCLFHRLWFFCALEAVVRTLVQFDSINFAFHHWAKCIADPPHTLYT